MTRDEMIQATVDLHVAEHKHQMRTGAAVYHRPTIESTIDAGLAINETITIVARKLRAIVVSDAEVRYEASSDNGQSWRVVPVTVEQIPVARDKALVAKSLNASRARG